MWTGGQGKDILCVTSSKRSRMIRFTVQLVSCLWYRIDALRREAPIRRACQADPLGIGLSYLTRAMQTGFLSNRILSVNVLKIPWATKAHGCLSGPRSRMLTRSLGLVRQIAQRAPIFLPFGLRHLRAIALCQLPSTLLILLHNPGSNNWRLAV